MAGIGIGVIGLLISVVGAFSDIDRFFQVYLLSFLLWVELTIGCLAFYLLLHLVDGRWGFASRRIFAAGARVMPLMAVLYIPLLFRLPELYPWAGAELTPSGYATFHSIPFFIGRLVVYFLIWIGAAYYLSDRSYESDDHAKPEAYPAVQRLAAFFMVLFIVIGTLASFDWIMSITKEWFSTIFGWLALGRQGVLAMTFAIMILALVSGDKSIKKLVNDRTQKDLATLVLVTLMLWIYLTVMQYFIMWSGNQPSKIKWFLPRTTGTWESVVIFLTIAHAIPLVLLLTPGLKKFRTIIAIIAAWLFLMRFVELFWLIMPSYIDDFAISIWDFALPIGMGGLWLAVFAWFYKAHALIPENHPNLADALAHETAEHQEGVTAH